MSARLGLPVIPTTLVAIFTLVALVTNQNQIISLRVLLGLLMISVAVIETVLSKKVGRKTRDGRDAMITAFLSIALFGLTLGDIGVVPLIGFFGAYQAILAVHLGISAFPTNK
jgi:chromate transport protein ChrA